MTTPARRAIQAIRERRGLHIWQNGCEMMIARSPDGCADIFNAPLDTERDADLLSKPTDWTLVKEDPLELLVQGEPESLTQAEWIALMGEGWLCLDGGDVVPRDR